MTDPARVLVVAATARELAEPRGWRVLQCGVGPVEAAAMTAASIAVSRPAAILHVGIAGARRAAGLLPPAFVIGRESVYCDSPERTTLGPEASSGHAVELSSLRQRGPGGVATPPRSILADAALLSAARGTLPDASLLLIGTSARVGGSTGCDVEAMEGYGVLRAAQLAGIPAIEVRAISNEIEEADRARWKFAEAFAALVDATPRLVDAIARCVS